MSYQPKTGAPCSCRRGVHRDNCPACEGTGQRIDFAAIRAPKAYEPITRERTSGRKVTRTTTPEEKIAALREIVATCTFAIIDGCTVDLFSASAIVQVHDAINEQNRARYLTLSIPKMADVAFKLANGKS